MAFQYPKKKKLALTWQEFELILYCVKHFAQTGELPEGPAEPVVSGDSDG